MYELAVLLFVFFIIFTPIQAALTQSTALDLFELFIISMLVSGHAILFIHYKKSPLSIASRKLKNALGFLTTEQFRLPLNLILGIPFIWFLSSLYMHSVSYLSDNNQIFYLSSLIYLFGAFLYVLYFSKFNKSPILALWSYLSYDNYKSEPKQTITRKILTWLGSLIIFYVFATNLIGFLRGNTGATLSILSFDIISIENYFEIMRYSLWSLTIFVCFVAYSSSIISILWGKYVRNLDFTVAGWLTNGFCYPLFGIIIWQMVPSLHGNTEIITSDVWKYFMLSLELLLNLLYTLSIINLGLMFGVMSDKGLKTSGFFAVTRHPNYTLESMMFVVIYSSSLSGIAQWIAVSMYLFIYWLRSEREDNFMNHSNLGYVDYKKQTPYKFIPGLY